MSGLDLPDEIWIAIIQKLLRPIPPVGSTVTQRDVHQQDLTSMMRVDKRMHDLTGPHLYRCAVADDLLSFAHGHDSAPSPPANPSELGHRQRAPKRQLLSMTRRIYTIGGLSFGLTNQVRSTMGVLAAKDMLGRTRSDRVFSSGFHVPVAVFAKSLHAAAMQRSKEIAQLSQADLLPSLDRLAIGAYTAQTDLPYRPADLQWRIRHWTLGIRNNFRPEHMCQHDAPDEDVDWPIELGQRRGTFTLHSANLNQLPQGMIRDRVCYVEPITPVQHFQLWTVFDSFAKSISGDADSQWKANGREPLVILILPCMRTCNESEEVLSTFWLTSSQSTTPHACAEAYLSACQAVWRDTAELFGVPAGIMRITTCLTAGPCMACGARTETDWIQELSPSELREMEVALRCAEKEFEEQTSGKQMD